MLRQIDVQNYESVTPAEQPAPMLDWVQISKIVIDEDFQRPMGRNNWASVQKIAASFQWSRFSPVILAPVEGGMFSIIDGQHRTHAAAICGFDRVPAMVVPVSKSEQALAFVHVNSTQIRVSAHQVYRAALTARAPWAEACREAVEAAGCTLKMLNNTPAANKQPGDIYCIGLVRGLVERGKGWAVTAGLSAMRQYDEQGKAAFYSDYILNPWLTAVATEPKHQRADLVAALRFKNPYAVIEAADRVAKSEGKPLSAYRRDMFTVLIHRAMQPTAA